MKTTFGLWTIFLWFFFRLEADDSVRYVGQKARAFAQTRDFTQASLLYEQLAQHPLPDWQKALVLYDWGTVKIYQQQWEQALERFNQIPLASISSPLLLRSLQLNEALAYYGFAQSLTDPSHSNLDEQGNLFRKSLKKLQEAIETDCRIQMQEKALSTLSDCQPSSDLALLSHHLFYQMNQILQKQRQQFISSASLSTVWLILQKGLRKLSSNLSYLNQPDLPSSFSSTYLQAFFSQANSLSPLWNQLEELELSHEQLAKLEEASGYYGKAINLIDEKNEGEAEKELFRAQKALKDFVKVTSLDEVILHYHLALINELNKEQMQSLLEEQLSLSANPKDQPILEQANHFLKTGLQKLDSGHLLDARFFLLSSLLQIESLQDDKLPSTPLSILQKALHKAEAAWQLTQLAYLTEQSNKELHSLFMAQQEAVFKQADLFIGSSLSQEDQLFQKGSCQKDPWLQVIPLFEEGYQAAKNAQVWMKNDPWPATAVMEQQKHTIRSWRQAIQALQQPPQKQNEDEQSEKKSSSSATSHDINETLRLIQEMQAQDEAQKEQAPQESDTW